MRKMNRQLRTTGSKLNPDGWTRDWREMQLLVTEVSLTADGN